METLVYRWVPDNTGVLAPDFVPGGFDAFRCLIVLDRPVSDEMRFVVSDLLVGRGCRYAMAHGPQSTLWDDSIDHACLAQFDYGDLPADRFVMTTWHDKEPLEDTLRFAKVDSLVSYNDTPLDALLILDFSDRNRAAQIKDLYARAV